MRRHSPKAVITVTVAAIFSLIVVCIGTIFYAGIFRVGSSYTISAYVSNARGIAPNSTIYEAGLPAGLVTGVKRNGPDAILTMRFSSGPRPLPVDSTVQLGLRSLVGEVDASVTVGTSSQTVRNGGSLGLSQDQSYTEVDQILNSFAGSTEDKTRNFFQGVGTAVAGEGQQLNNTVGNFSQLVINSLPLTSSLAAEHTQVADIVQNFGNLMGAIGQRTTALQQFATGAQRTFQDVADRNVALKKGLTVLPGLFRNVAKVADAFKATEPSIAPVVNQVSQTLVDLKPTINALKPATRSGITLVNALGAADPQLTKLLSNVTQLKPSATTALPAVHSLLCQLNPILTYAAPYGPDISAFFENFGEATDAYGDAHQLIATLEVQPSHIIRGVASQPAEQGLDELLNDGVFSKLGSTAGYDPQEGPGNADNTTIGLGDDGPAEFGADHTYPHVTENCNG